MKILEYTFQHLAGFGETKERELWKKNIFTWDDFEKVDMRAGTIISAEDFPKARKPSYILTIDFGEAGIRKSSAQITHFYSKEELIGLQVIAVINFPEKQIANFFSQCLVLGVYTPGKEVVLLSPLQKIHNGAKVG